MIQELYFVPHSKSRSLNQMNTSVTLRYDTKTLKLQLIDVFGKAKSISIDTDPDDLTMDNLYATITTDFVKGLGFETAEETAAKMPVLSGGYGVGISVDGVTNTVYIKKNIINEIIQLALNEGLTEENIWDSFTFTSGLTFTSGTVTVDESFLDNFMSKRGYLPGDNDHMYQPSTGISLTITEGTEENPSGSNYFSVDQEWLSGFVGTYLDENQYVNTQDAPVTLAGGEGISVEVQEQGEGLSANVISLTAHIPTGVVDVWETSAVTNDISGLGFIQLADVPIYTGVEGIAVDQDNKLISLTAYIPTGLADWTADDTSAYIRGQGFALTGELSDTQYYADNTSLTLGEGNIFTINQQWLEGFVANLGYMKVDNDTTYAADEDSILMNSDRVFSVNTTWLSETVAPLVVSNITTEAGQIAVKSVVTKEYISGLGFRLAEEDDDTLYTAAENGGLSLASTAFSVDTNWLSAIVDTYIDNHVTSTFISSIGVKITDTTVAEGAGIDVEYSENDPLVQLVSVDPTWISGQISAYNEENGINHTPTLAAGEGIGFRDVNDVKEISLTAVIPSGLNNWKSADNKQYISSIGFAQTSDIPVYAADEDSIKLTVEVGTEQLPDRNVFSVNTEWLDNVINSKGFAQASAVTAIEDQLTGFALKSEIPTGLTAWDNQTNADYIASLGFRLSDNDTQYGVVSEGGLTVNTEHNFAIDTNWMNNRLSGYALKLELPVIPSAVSEFENDANYATVEQLPTTVSQLVNDKSFVTAAELEAIRLNILSQIATMVTVTTIDGDVNAAGQNLFVDVNDTLTSNVNFTGKNITVNGLTNQDSFVTFTGTEDVTLTKVNNSGTLAKEVNGSQVIINTPGRVVITDSTIAQKGYTGIDIGASELPKSVLIDGVNFTGKLNRQAICIYGTADNAVVTISNCTFANVKEAIRLSNRSNAHVTINIVNCLFTAWEDGMIFCYDYTSNNDEQIATNNLFAPEKVTINITNCTKAGVKILVDDLDAVCGTGDENQIIYVSNKSTNVVARGADKYPTISVN